MASIMINDYKVHYQLEGEGVPVVLMHGWGQNLRMMQPIFDALKSDFKVLSFDFLGFGESDQPKTSMSVEDYCHFLQKLLKALEIENPILIAHSFGCRVSFHYSYHYPVRKMVLTGAAGLKDYHVSLKNKLFTSGKKVLACLGLQKVTEQLSRHVGSADYKNASGVMKETLVKVVNDDVRPLLPHIAIPTLLVFGQYDEATPLTDAYEIEKLMPDCGVVVFENDDHYAYYHQSQRFNAIVEVFLKEDK